MAENISNESICRTIKIPKLEKDYKGSKYRVLRGRDWNDDEYVRQYILFHCQYEKTEGFKINWEQFDYLMYSRTLDEAPPISQTRSNAELITEVTLFAIEKHNEAEGTKLEYVEHIEANYKIINGFLYWLTFWARDMSSSSPESRIYQAKVWLRGEEFEIPIFRLKPTDEEMDAVEVKPPSPIRYDMEKPLLVFARPGPGEDGVPFVFNRTGAPDSCLNASATIDYIKSKIESCIYNYMSYEEIVTNLQKNYKIGDHLINPIWERLHRDNPDFYKHYHLRCQVLRQIKIFNELLVKQVTLAQQHLSSLTMPITITDYYHTAPQDSYVPEYFGHSDSSLPLRDSDFLEKMQFDEIYEPHIEIQNMFAPEEPQTIMEQCGGSSNGETRGQEFGLNFDTSQITQRYASFDQQQAQEVMMLPQQKHHYNAEETIQLHGGHQIPESEALNNPGDERNNG